MKRPSAYPRSQRTLLEFAEKFNADPSYPNLYCCPIVEETMLNDGCFVDVKTIRMFAFDWEIREDLKSIKPGEFPYPTLSEFERKFAPEKKTQLFVQCDDREKYLAVAWREDFLKEAPVERTVSADKGKQRVQRRETPNF